MYKIPKGFVIGMMSVTIVMNTSTIQAQITPEHVSKIKQISSVTMSDDGSTIAYTLSLPADPKSENAGSKNVLYVMNANTGIGIPYYTSGSVSQVKFRPNTQSISFVTKQEKDSYNAIYEINIHGGEARKVYSHTANITAYDWHPSGQSLVVGTSEKAAKPKTSLTYAPTFFEEEMPNRNAYLVNMVQGIAQVTMLDANGSIYLMKWNNAGTRIALSVAPTSSVDDSYMKQQVKIIDPYDKSISALVNNQGKLQDIVWSPDDNRLALLAAKDLHDPTDGCVLLVSASGGTPQQIDADFLGKYESISWANPNSIDFVASESTATGIGYINVNDGKKGYYFFSKEHHITSATVMKGKIAFAANSPAHPTELFLINDIKKATPRRLTSSNPTLESLKLGRQEVVTYKARDGKYDIQGMLIYPVDYVAGNKYPVITVVHGGPEAHYSNGWLTAYSMPGQMAAANGYAVFYPNYRGSTGRGTDFTYSSQGDHAGAEFDDIVDGVDHLIQQGIADRDRIGVTGGSYGGYASAWMSTYYSDRFAAAVMFVGISNNISKFGTSDIPSEMHLVHLRKHVWDDWLKELERSPIYHVDRSNTPILIMHGAEDPRVHPAQSMELYRHIKVRKPDVPVRLIYYPGEGHGNTKSGSRYDYNLRMMQWFDTYLKTGNRKAKIPSLDLPE